MIVALEEAKRKLTELVDVVAELGNQLRIEEARERAQELERETMVQDFWNDAEKSSKTLREIKQLKDKVESYEALSAKLEDTLMLCEMAIEEGDDGSVEEVVSETEFIETEAERKRIEVLLSGPYDKNNAIVSFHPGAGGTEAQDWASMLYRLYTRWGEKHGFNVKLVDWLDGDEAGIKSATIMVEGPNAYGYLKSENGVHRLVRISPFDSSGRRHTSFSSVEVMPEFEDDDSIVIKDEDMEIKLREKLEKIEDIQGNKANIEWGSQIRSYVFMPYTLAKDTRTGYEDGNIDAVMDGEIDGFINAYLKHISKTPGEGEL